MTTVEKILNETVRGLQDMGYKLTGEDSPLGDVWEEIKYQVQVEESHSWEVYEVTMMAFIEGAVEVMKPEERQRVADELVYVESYDLDAISNELYEKLLERLV